MKVRHKLFLASSSLVLLTSVVFFTISHGYMAGLFRQYAQAALQNEAGPWAAILENYYEANNESWSGVQGYLANNGMGVYVGNTDQIISLVLYDQKGQRLVGITSTPSGLTPPHHDQHATDSVNVPLSVSGKKIGSLQIRSRGIEGLFQIEQLVLHSAMLATVWGTIVTAVIALLMGAWFSRVLTKPLQTIVEGMRRIGGGNLDTKLPAETSDEFGEVAHAFNDMTERLSRTEEARRHLVADVAHELRMPLTIMQGQMELIQQGVKAPVPETLLPIQDEVFRLTRLVQDLHQLSLAEVGKLSLVRELTSPVYLLERIAENFEIEFEESKIEFSFKTDVSPQTLIYVDPDRITQVVVNLLGNAIRYTPGGGQVRVGLMNVGSEVRIDISDTGPGISEDHLAHIFDRFYRADEDRSRETGGTGLGLAIAKEFVEAHLGRIAVTSEVGQGTTFTVWLPVVDADTAQVNQPNESAAED